MPRLLTVSVSTRPGRKGPAVAAWFNDLARAHGSFEVVPVDLGELQLPLFDEPAHPRLRMYQHAHTHAWSALVDGADAFAFVMPEYNYSPPPSFTNALDYLQAEWACKPACFVTYGGISGGMRALQVARLQVSNMRMVPLVESVSFTTFTKYFADDGVTFAPEDSYAAMAGSMLDELLRWARALRGMRATRTS
jgi:NAD(P)H-dependent FMN reductase